MVKKVIHEYPTLLVCANKEEYSKVALHFACRLAKKNKGKITILHVIEPVDYQSIGMVAKKMQQEKLSDAKALLKSLSQEVKNFLKTPPTLLLREGLIEEEIIQVLEEDNSINMMVAGAPGDEAPKSKILPPLVSELGQKIQVPMLIVPGSLTEHQIEELT